MKELIDLIETYKDFPSEGIEFKDVLGIVQEPKIFQELILFDTFEGNIQKIRTKKNPRCKICN